MPTYVNPDKCDGCKALDRPACMYICPNDLMTLDVPEGDEATPRILALACENDAYPALDMLVYVLLVSLPDSKLAHLVYRTAALLHDRASELARDDVVAVSGEGGWTIDRPSIKMTARNAHAN
jgi:hypothetical protein